MTREILKAVLWFSFFNKVRMCRARGILNSVPEGQQNVAHRGNGGYLCCW